MPASRGTYGGKTTGERVEQRRAALIDAAMTIMAEQGWRRLTIDRVCDQAGLIRRYFYESFPDVDALGTAVVDEIYAGILVVALQENKSQPLPQLINTVVRVLVDHAAEDPRRIRVLYAEMASNEAAATHRRATARRLNEIFVAEARLVAEARSTPGFPTTDPIIDLAATMLVNGTAHILLDWVDGVTSLTRDELAETLERLWTTLVLGVVTGTE